MEKKKPLLHDPNFSMLQVRAVYDFYVKTKLMAGTFHGETDAIKGESLLFPR